MAAEKGNPVPNTKQGKRSAASLGVIILAAGQGTRMKSMRPKVLHRLAGRPLLQHVVDTATALGAARIAVVFGHGGARVREGIGGAELVWVEQAKQLGTGHAVEQALPAMAGMDRVLVLYGDVPLTSWRTLEALSAEPATPLAILTAELPDPSGYGRILRDDAGEIVRIVEHRDATPEERRVREINTGILVAERARLERWIARLENSNSQGEFYLTDIVSMAVGEGCRVGWSMPMDPAEILGVNDRAQLAHLERHYQRTRARELMRDGVTLLDPARFDLRGSLTAGRDVEIDVNVILEGDVVLGDGVRIGANSVIRGSRLGDGVEVLENCVIEGAEVGAGCRIGPFARLRPGTRLDTRVHAGNFVEIKNSVVAPGSKINHLSYVGDADVGSGVNIGAGTITCNYDGAHKHRTVIGDQAFIGSNTALVAPVRIGADATIGAGSVISRDAPPGGLTLERGKQVTLEGWRRPRKDK